MGDETLDQEFAIVELEPRQAASPDAWHWGSGGSGGSGGGSTFIGTVTIIPSSGSGGSGT